MEEQLNEFFSTLRHTAGPWGAIADGGEHSAWSVYAPNDVNSYICKTSGNCKPNSKLIAASPDMLRTLCRTYLQLLIKFSIGQNSTVDSIRISLDSTLADLNNRISAATGLKGEYIQDLFEAYAHAN